MEKYVVDVTRVGLDSDMRPYKVVVSVDFEEGYLEKCEFLDNVKNEVLNDVFKVLEKSVKLKPYNISKEDFSYFNSEAELENHRILFSFLVRNTTGYNDWLKGKDVIWFNENSDKVVSEDHIFIKKLVSAVNEHCKEKPLSEFSREVSHILDKIYPGFALLYNPFDKLFSISDNKGNNIV